MTTNRAVTVDNVLILALYDGHRYVDASALYDKSPDDWRPYQHFVDARLRLRMDYGGFLVRTPHHLVIVDPGAAPANAVDGGHLLTSLADLGVALEAITHVVFTHLHLDHVGGAVKDGRPTFPNAVYLCDSAELDFFRAGPPPGLESDIHRRNEVVDLLSPLHDRLEPLVRGSSIVPTIHTEWAPGHTPGSSIVVVASGARRALMLGDAVHCPVELLDPEWALLQDVDPRLARTTRERLATTLEGDDTIGTAGHFPGLEFGRVLMASGGRTWVPPSR